MEQNYIGFITVAFCGGYISKYPRLKPNDSLAKVVFLLRLYDYMFTSISDVTIMTGFCPRCLLPTY